MKVNYIAGFNYNIMSKNLNDNSSNPVFKGQNFARILKKNYRETKDKNIFDLFKDLIQKASEEVGFKKENDEMFGNLKAVKNKDDLVSLLKTWHLQNPLSTVIANDSNGPLIEYVVSNPNSVAHTNAIKELCFSSVGNDGCKQQVSLQTAKIANDIAQSLVDSSGNRSFYDISEAQYR